MAVRNEGRERGAEWLRSRLAGLDSAGGPERRHETLMEQSEAWGLERVEAEAVYALAEEEGFEPELALLLRASGVGVSELEPVEAELGESGQQQAPPDWVAAVELAPAEAQRERRLRLSFRRLQSLLTAGNSAGEAVDRFLAEPDVVEDAY